MKRTCVRCGITITVDNSETSCPICASYMIEGTGPSPKCARCGRMFSPASQRIPSIEKDGDELRTVILCLECSLKEIPDYKKLEACGFKVVYGVFVISAFVFGFIGIKHLTNANLLYSLWSIASIYLTTKATLAIVLIIGRKSFVFGNMPLLFWDVFPGTMNKYRGDSCESLYGNPVEGITKQLLLVAIALIPIIALLIT